MALASLRSQAASVVTVDSSAAGNMSGFELWGNGYYWWNTGYPGDEVTHSQVGQIGIRTITAGAFINRNPSRTFQVVAGTTLVAPPGGVARNGADLYFFATGITGNRIYRRTAFGPGPSELGNDFGGLAYDSVGAMTTWNGLLFWSTVQGTDGQIRSKPLSGGPGGGDTIEVSLASMGTIKKMATIDIVNAQGGFSVETDLIFLTNDGKIYRYILSPFRGVPVLIASNVTDFFLRNESSRVFRPPFTTTTVYASYVYTTTGINFSDSRTQGSLVGFDLSDGSSFTAYQTGDVNLQLTAVGGDTDRLYVTRTPLTFQGVLGGFGGWVLDPANAQILRQNNSANKTGILSIPGDFETVALQQAAQNLRSDGTWLYFMVGNQLRKLKTDAPAIQLDYKAVGLEVVQEIQDYNDSVPLVAGKPTLVRGYAQMVANTTGVASFPINGTLSASRNGTPLYPPFVNSWNSPVVDNAGDLPTLRGNLNRSLLFDLPQEWLAQPGPLHLSMTVNPSLDAPETGDTPLANNTVSTDVKVVSTGTPCLIFVIMSSTFPNYDPNAPNSSFGDILNRAVSLLPITGFRYGIRSGSLTKPVVTLTGIKGRSFNMPSDSNWALELLGLSHLFDKNPDGCPDTHWVGMFPAQEQNFNGLGNISGNNLLIRMGPELSQLGSIWSGPRGGFALAHELGHNYGLQHIYTPTNCTSQIPAGPYDSYNANPCTLGDTDLTKADAPVAYDYETGSLIQPTQAGELMTYAYARWISGQNWGRLIGANPTHDGLAVSAMGASGPVILAHGFIDTNSGSGILLPALRFDAGTLDDTTVQQSIQASAALPTNTPVRLRLLDGNGSVLSDYAALISQSADSSNSSALFQQFLPLDPAVQKLQLVNAGNLLAELAASPNPPVLTLGTPTLDPTNGILSLSWTASDADGDPLLFSVQYSHDDGASWQSLRVQDPSLGISVGTRLLPGGTSCRLRVFATDGFNTTIAATDGFVVPKQGPLLTFGGLHNLQAVPYGSNLVVRAFAYDAEDGSLDPAGISWSLSGPETRTGTGATFSLNWLPPGSYSLSIQASDADQNQGSNTAAFTVLPVVVPDGDAPVMDGLCGDAAYNQGALVRLHTGTNAPDSYVRLIHSGGYLYAGFYPLAYSSSADLAASVSLNVDTNATHDATAQPGDIGFGVDENGIPYQTAGNGQTMTRLSSVASGFNAVIARGDNSWSAELQIPDSLLGGWNHNAGLMLAHYFPNLFGAVKLWPTNANPDQPSTWTTASFGPLAPVPDPGPNALPSGPAVVAFSEPTTVALDGAASYDLDSDALTYTWTQVDGPPVTLQNANSATPSFATSDVGGPAVLTFQLVVNDGKQDSQAATVRVALAPVSSQPPPASTPASVQVGNSGAVMQLTWPGSVGDTAIIQASTDLINWVAIDTNIVGGLSTIVFQDVNASQYPYRFYRAVSYQAPTPQPAAGKALQFPGTQGDFGTVAIHQAELNVYPLTITAWISTTQSSPNAIGVISKYIDTSLNGYSIFLLNGHLRAWYFKDGSDYVWDGSEGLDGGLVADGQWHHIAFTVGDNGGALYVDGIWQASLPWTGTPGVCSSTTPLVFGHYDAQTVNYIGQMDEASLWNTALSANDIIGVFQQSVQGPIAGLQGLWRFDDGSGTTATDSSTNGNDIQLTPQVQWIDSTAPINR